MKKQVVILALLALGWAQGLLAKTGEILVEVAAFRKVVASPKIRVVLTKGDREQVRLEFSGVDQGRINAKVSGQTLRIWLTGARITERSRRCGPGQWCNDYEGAEVTAYVTYRELRSVALRGEEKLVCDDTLQAKKMKLKLYGRAEVKLAGLRTERLKVWMYGENGLKIASGSATDQKYKSYGENEVDVQALAGERVKTVSFGENGFRVGARERLRVKSLGESQVRNSGPAKVSRGLVLGHANIWQTAQ
jgi:hypothetical protein